MSPTITRTLSLSGLRFGPPQVWGGVRMVPLLRDRAITDLRLHVDDHIHAGPLVAKGRRDRPHTTYHAYTPMGAVLRFSKDGTAVTLPTGVLGKLGKRGGRQPPRRVIQRIDARTVHMLPMHLAISGFLLEHFGGPTVAWEQWSNSAIRWGLGVRGESFVLGDHLVGLREALRVFELHPDQCGVVLHVGGSLAAIRVMPHPADYRRLHPRLVMEHFAPHLVWHAVYGTDGALPRAELDDTGIHSLDDLSAAIRTHRAAWAESARPAAIELVDREVSGPRVRKLGKYTLWRFVTGTDELVPQHIGEAVHHANGTLASLSTCGLSRNAVRRAHLLEQLAHHDWHPRSTAEGLGLSPLQLARRLTTLGMGQLVGPLDRWR